jgi:hypothetical protein
MTDILDTAPRRDSRRAALALVEADNAELQRMKPSSMASVPKEAAYRTTDRERHSRSWRARALVSAYRYWLELAFER